MNRQVGQQNVQNRSILLDRSAKESRQASSASPAPAFEDPAGDTTTELSLDFFKKQDCFNESRANPHLRGYGDDSRVIL
jgi:hypothetical protein